MKAWRKRQQLSNFNENVLDSLEGQDLTPEDQAKVDRARELQEEGKFEEAFDIIGNMFAKQIMEKNKVIFDKFGSIKKHLCRFLRAIGGDAKKLLDKEMARFMKGLKDRDPALMMDAKDKIESIQRGIMLINMLGDKMVGGNLKPELMGGETQALFDEARKGALLAVDLMKQGKYEEANQVMDAAEGLMNALEAKVKKKEELQLNLQFIDAIHAKLPEGAEKEAAGNLRNKVDEYLNVFWCNFLVQLKHLRHNLYFDQFF